MHIPIAEPLPFDANQVTPGWIGFTATALVAIVVILLMWDFNRRVRRMADRAEAKERIAEELAEQERARSEQRGQADGSGAAVGPGDPHEAGQPQQPGAPQRLADGAAARETPQP